MNYKSIGEMGQNCVIGELSKYAIGVAPVLSDNYPFEMIAITDKKLFKIQVKTSTENKNGEYIHFNISSNDWFKGISKKYTKEDCDIMVLYDLVEHKCFLLGPCDFENRSHFTIRYKGTKNNQSSNINYCDKYIISEDRIKEIFNFDVPNMRLFFSNKTNRNKREYELVCHQCGKEFKSYYKKSKCCSDKCRGLLSRIVERPSKEELKLLIEKHSLLQISKKFQVSDKTIKKWSISYNLL